MKRFFYGAAAIGVLISASAIFATPGVLKTTNGQTYSGDISDNGDNFTVANHGIDSQIPKTQVASVTYTDPSSTIVDTFNQRMSTLGPRDAEGRVKLARFAFDNGRNDLAIQALSVAMQIDPNNAEAIDMLKTVQAQQTLQQNKAAQAAAAANAPTAPVDNSITNPPVSPMAVAKKFLTPADINDIRQHEIHPGEQIAITIPNDLKRKFAALIGVSYSEFDALAPEDQMQQIMQKGTKEMKAAVKISRDPLAIMHFKQHILPMVLRNCATSACHGGANGGNFILYNSNDQAAVYTNFYIMEQFSMKTAGSTGFFGGGGERKMIERGDGAHSLLVDFALPPGQGDVSHPKVPNSGFNGIFHGRDEPLYNQTVDWMNKDLNLIAPNYDIDYTPPVSPATSQPTTLP
jgi:hypothetical protein